MPVRKLNCYDKAKNLEYNKEILEQILIELKK